MSRFPIVAANPNSPWREIKRAPMRSDDRFVVRYSQGLESRLGYAAWSISILEPGRGCLHERHHRDECRVAPAVVVRVFRDAPTARLAWLDAVAGNWGRFYARPGAPWRAQRSKSPGYGQGEPQHRKVLDRYARGLPRNGGGSSPLEAPGPIPGAAIADPTIGYELVRGEWIATELKRGR